MTPHPHTLSVAPMMDWTDRHDRFLLRLISRHVRLYTEMVTTGAILHGDKHRHLDFNAAEQPLALQLGGSEPADLAECARIAEDWGYAEVNLNIGCPSERVQKGAFGACLMLEPLLVARGVKAMVQATSLPVTVKCRLGVDEKDDYQSLLDFSKGVIDAGARVLIVHARKAWLSGLSPKENREIPPLDYDRVYRLKQDLGAFPVIINGGILSLDEVDRHRKKTDGVMIGRAAYQDPYVLAEADRRFFDPAAPVRTRRDVVEAMLPYIEERLAAGDPLKAITRHMLGLYNGLPGARAWRRTLSETARSAADGPALVRSALEEVEASIERARLAA